MTSGTDGRPLANSLAATVDCWTGGLQAHVGNGALPVFAYGLSQMQTTALLWQK